LGASVVQGPFPASHVIMTPRKASSANMFRRDDDTEDAIIMCPRNPTAVLVPIDPTAEGRGNGCLGGWPLAVPRVAHHDPDEGQQRCGTFPADGTRATPTSPRKSGAVCTSLVRPVGGEQWDRRAEGSFRFHGQQQGPHSTSHDPIVAGTAEAATSAPGTWAPRSCSRSLGVVVYALIRHGREAAGQPRWWVAVTSMGRHQNRFPTMDRLHLVFLQKRVSLNQCKCFQCLPHRIRDSGRRPPARPATRADRTRRHLPPLQQLRQQQQQLRQQQQLEETNREVLSEGRDGNGRERRGTRHQRQRRLRPQGRMKQMAIASLRRLLPPPRS
jgi:hypothetical protein